MKRSVLVVGPTPPPHYGVAVATRTILDSDLGKQVPLLHLDTSDRREALNFGAVDFTNVYLACLHIARLFLLLATRKPSVVYIPISQGAAGYLRDAVFIFLCALSGARTVLHLRGARFRAFYDESSGIMRWIIRRSLARADRMIVLGESLRHLFDGLIDRAKIRVVPNGVDPDEFTPAAVPDRESHKVRLCYLSQMYRTKGYADVLQALTRLEPGLDFECRFAGKWESESERQFAEAYVREHHLERVVNFVGAIHGRQKRDLLQSSDIFVFPTYYPAEGHPWAILEAMASGLPVISTDHACIPETLIDGECGFVVPKRDIDALSARISTLVKDPELRIRMGAAARRRIQGHFNRDLFIRRLAAVFMELLDSPAS